MQRTSEVKIQKKNRVMGTSGKLNMRTKSTVVLKKIKTLSELPIKFLAERVFEITPSTLRKYMGNNLKFPSLLKEHSLRFLEMYETGLEVFGNNVEFNLWLTNPSLGLGFEVPADLLNTSRGVESIFEELKRIGHGDTA